MSGENRGGCLRCGCLTCVGCLALPFAMALFGLVGYWIQGPTEERLEDVHRSQELPAVPQEARIVLDVSSAFIEIVAAETGAPLRVEGQYDAAAYQLRENFDDRAEGWEYHFTFQRKGGFQRPFGRKREANRLRLFVPQEVPFTLAGSIGTGESRLALGGLSVVGLDLDLGTGSHELSFDGTPAVPMKDFQIDASIGELSVRGVGNASPETVRIGHRMGSVNVDLGGGWARDASIEVRCGVGECRVRVPQDVAVSLDESSVRLGDERVVGIENRPAPREGAPVLHLSVSGEIGQVEIDG